MAKKAIVLAAGLGTRLRPLTCVAPKPLLPVWGEPMLARVVAKLRELGVEEIVVNCHYLHEQVEEWCRANGCRASYEPTILGTGGVLNPLRDWIGEDEFYLVNGDIVIENLPKLEVPKKDCLGACLVVEQGPRTVEIEPELGYVTNWKSDDPGWSGTYTYCGFALLRSEILDYVEPTGFSSIVTAYEKAMMAGRFMKAVTAENLLWTDAGTVNSYVEVNTDGDDNALADLPQLKAIGAKQVNFIGVRGSDRVFFKADGRVVVVYDDSKRGENARYATEAKWLKARGMPVPAVLQDLPELKTTVFEWGGESRKMKLEEYVKVVDVLARFNALGAGETPDMEPAFDSKLWQWERDLFSEFCLGRRYQRQMPAAVKAELKNVSALLEKEPKALVHRDFQSSNVLWKDDCPCIIDFQGMRLGPAAYDLASLVYDPYVELSEGERRALVALYGKVSGRPEIAKVLPYAAVQRLVQCLGAFGRLASVGQLQFARHVPRALGNLLDAADKAGLDAIGALAEDLIATEMNAVGHHHHGHNCHCGHCHDEEE